MSIHSPSRRLEFTKMNGAGNDFVMIDNRDSSLSLNPDQIKKLCDRHRGIGADGVILLELTSNNELNMRYYNADGYEVDMCGNGARCFTRFTADLLGKKTVFIEFQTPAGKIQGELLEDLRVKLLMSEPHSLQLAHSLHLNDHDYELHSINTGVPHVVIFTKDLKNTPVIELGRLIRNHARFAPNGTNANFVQVASPKNLIVRTYERGVEDETQACGTGVVATAIIHHLLTKTPSPISISVVGGDTLEVGFETSSSNPSEAISVKNITLTGPADFTFKGYFEL